jgi:hypothetical protein
MKMAKFRFDPDFSNNKMVIFCKSKIELIESLYHQIHVKIEDLKILSNPEEKNYLVIMLAPFRERLLVGYVDEKIE